MERGKGVLSLKSMGLKVDSKANFIFISHLGKTLVLFKRLRKRDSVRHFDKPRISCLRVSIGSDEEMDVFLDVIGKLLV